MVNVQTESSRETMKPIPGGEVLIGSMDGSEAERPVRRVIVTPFLLDTSLVTNAAFREFVDATGYVSEAERAGFAWGYADGEYQRVKGLSWRSYANDRDSHPVVLVSWNDALTYATWLKKRLPTEIEWEAAAKAGAEEALYPWGSDSPDGRCNWKQAAASIPPTTPVAHFAPNAYGLYDMVGNVWQWCADDFTTSYATHLPAQPGLKCRRGGAWNVIQAFRLRCANRGAMNMSMTAPNVGFRCAQSL
jgi:sulfatase modifying factor 1